MSSAGSWSAGGGVQTDKTAAALLEFDKELKDLAGGRSISEEELAHAKTRRVRGYAQQFESLGRIATQVGTLWALGLPMTELQREYEATQGLTLQQVLAVTKTYVKPESSGLLLVGDRAKVESDVRELKLGEIVFLDADGRPVASANPPATSGAIQSDPSRSAGRWRRSAGRLCRAPE